MSSNQPNTGYFSQSVRTARCYIVPNAVVPAVLCHSRIAFAAFLEKLMDDIVTEDPAKERLADQKKRSKNKKATNNQPVFVREKKKATIFVRDLCSKTVSVQIAANNPVTVADLKKAICKKTKVPVGRQRLLFQGSKLADVPDDAILTNPEMMTVQLLLQGGLAGGGGGQSKAKQAGQEKVFAEAGPSEEEFSGFDDAGDGADWWKEKIALEEALSKRDKKVETLEKKNTTLKKELAALKDSAHDGAEWQKEKIDLKEAMAKRDKKVETLEKELAALNVGDAADWQKEKVAYKKKIAILEKENIALKKKGTSPSGMTTNNTELTNADALASSEFSSTKAVMQINIDKLGGVYNALGQQVADLRGLEAELTALKKDKETAANKSWLQSNRIDPMEAVVEAAKKEETKFINDIIRMRNEFSEQAMPESKVCAARYSSIFEKQSSGSDGAAALKTICSAVASMKQSLPPAPKDGTKASKQPDEPVDKLQRAGVREAKKMYDAVTAALYTTGMDKTELKGSSVCETEKSAARGFEKVYRRWGGDYRAVTDWGRATVCTLTLVLLAKALEITLQTLTELGYTVVAVKNTLDSGINCTANGEYRNLMLNLKCPESGHVVELQFNVSSMEELKQTRGHTVFELLRRCGFSEKNSVIKGGWTSTMETAIRCGRAVELNCEEANWVTADVEMLTDALNAPGCRVSVMNGSYATGEGAVAMALSAVGCTTMKDLNLEENNLDSEAGKVIGEALAVNQTIQTIVLGWNNLGPEAGKAIGEALKVNKSIQDINLGGNDLDSESGKAIGEALKGNKTIQKIYLYNNNLGPDGGKAIGEALAVNQTIQTISLHSNKLGPEGGKAIGEALKGNKSIQTIRLEENNLGPEAGKVIGKALAVNQTIQTINLEYNDFDDHTKEALRRAWGDRKQGNLCLNVISLEQLFRRVSRI